MPSVVATPASGRACLARSGPSRTRLVSAPGSQSFALRPVRASVRVAASGGEDDFDNRLQALESMSPSPVAVEEPSSVPAEEVEAKPEEPEEVFYEGGGSNAELIGSLLLGGTLIYLPLTLASVGRKLWIKYRFTNKRVAVITESPVVQRTVEVPYDKIREVRTVSRGFGLWGDMVIFLKDGGRLEITGLDRFKEIEGYVNLQM